MNVHSKLVNLASRVVLLIIVVLTFIFAESTKKRANKRLAKTIVDMTYIKDSINSQWKKMGEHERRSKYQLMMMRILATYGYRYDEKYKKSMNREQKIDYVNVNYKLATAFHFELFDVPVIHKLETDFNPYEINTASLNERGLGQLVWDTALLAERLQRQLPDNLRRMVRFELKQKSDLFDPIINMKASYTLLYFLRRHYRSELWYVSCYHWGGFLGRYYDKGEGEVPARFTINGQTFHPLKYVQAYAELKEAWQTGQLEAGMVITEKWRDWSKRQKKEQIDFRKTRSIIRNLRKKLQEKSRIESEHSAKEKEIKKVLWKADRDLSKIAGESKRGGGVKSLQKVKKVAKDLLKKLNWR